MLKWTRNKLAQLGKHWYFTYAETPDVGELIRERMALVKKPITLTAVENMNEKQRQAFLSECFEIVTKNAFGMVCDGNLKLQQKSTMENAVNNEQFIAGKCSIAGAVGLEADFRYFAKMFEPKTPEEFDKFELI